MWAFSGYCHPTNVLIQQPMPQSRPNHRSPILLSQHTTDIPADSLLHQSFLFYISPFQILSSVLFRMLHQVLFRFKPWKPVTSPFQVNFGSLLRTIFGPLINNPFQSSKTYQQSSRPVHVSARWHLQIRSSPVPASQEGPYDSRSATDRSSISARWHLQTCSCLIPASRHANVSVQVAMSIPEAENTRLTTEAILPSFSSYNLDLQAHQERSRARFDK